MQIQQLLQNSARGDHAPAELRDIETCVRRER